jgi:hypothetical protein
MFVFEDISMLDDLAIRKSCSEWTRKRFRRHSRARTTNSRAILPEHVESSSRDDEGRNGAHGPVKMKDVHAAQQRIVEIVRKLEEEGIISLGPAAAEMNMSSRIIRADRTNVKVSPSGNVIGRHIPEGHLMDVEKQAFDRVIRKASGWEADG